MTSSYRSLYTYPWDIADQGVNAFVDDALNIGMRDVALATSYHAGKFIRPHGAGGARVLFPEDGVVYFDADQKKYGEIKPQLHSSAAMRQVLPDLLADGRLRVHAWTVLLHNSRIGNLYPHYCAHNAFGDAYTYSLCPMQDAVFDYAVALCADLAEQFPLHSLILETPGWLPYAHGFHHEFAQLDVHPWLDHALGLCFCAACKTTARQKQIEVDAVQLRVQTQISSALNSEASDVVQTLFAQDADLKRYVAMRQERVTALVSAIRAAVPRSVKLALIPSVQRPTAHCWAEGSDLAALADVADYLEIPFYEPTARRVLDDAKECLAHVAAEKLRGIVRPGHPDLKGATDLSDALEGLQRLGINQFGFYNYGLLPRYQLTRLATCLHQLKVIS